MQHVLLHSQSRGERGRQEPPGFRQKLGASGPVDPEGFQAHKGALRYTLFRRATLDRGKRHSRVPVRIVPDNGRKGLSPVARTEQRRAF